MSSNEAKSSTASSSGVTTTPHQEKVLESEFKQEKNWDEITIELVHAESGLSEKDVEV